MKRNPFSQSIIHDDENFLAINKWPGISTLSDRNNETCLLDLARLRYPDIQVCHRLDKYTSGILVFAKNQTAYKFLSLQFQNREVSKVYHALVEGRHDFKEKLIDLPLHHGRRGHARVSSTGKESETIINTIKHYGRFTLLECIPITGRTHQIRVHLTSVGAPIVGDVDYGGTELYLSDLKRYYNHGRDSVERPLMARPALHAQALSFKSSVEATIKLEAEYPKDYRATLNQLQKINSPGIGA